MRSGPTVSRPSTPFSRARSSSVVEARQLVVGQGHDELADPLDGDPLLGAVRLQRVLALAAEAGLQRARRVVEAGVDDAAVVAGLVGREPLLAFDEHEADVGPSAEHLASGRQAEDAAADDDDVGTVGWSRRGRVRGWTFEGAAATVVGDTRLSLSATRGDQAAS